MNITMQERFSPLDEAAITQGFAEYNRSQGQESPRQTIALTCHTADGRLAGALDGYIFFDWLTVSRLWVAPEARGQGLGIELMHAAEALARERCCVGSTLSTYDFQARPFYEKLGYAVFGVLSDNPRGRERFFMRKTF